MAAPLAGLRVLDIGQGIAAPFCAKLLGDAGADVVKVEPPGGDAARALGPFPDGRPDPELSAAFFYFNTSKRGVTLDLSRAEGRAMLARLLRDYDVVIAGETAGELAARGIGFEQLRAWNERVILTTVSGFGSVGPRAGYAWSHLIACAVGGWARTCGLPDREPLQAGGAITETLTGAFAAAATLLAVLGREAHGRGDHVDVSGQQATLAGALFPSLRYEYTGEIPGRDSSYGPGPSFILPTRRGYAGINVLTAAQWAMLCEFIGRADLLTDPRYAGRERLRRATEIREILAETVRDRTAEELFHEGQTWRIPFGLVPSMAEIVDLPPHRERGFLVELEHPRAGRVAVPGVPYKSSVTDPRPSRPPLLGEHNDELLPPAAGEEGDGDGDRTVAAVGAGTEEPSPPPLAGLRIVDLTMFFSGPLATQIAGDAGADVIKVESVQRIDGWRGATVADVERPWERAPNFVWVNRSKRGITLNLADARGAEILKRLVADADVLIENYTPRVMKNFGLEYETLRAINPRLIMISMPGFGSDVSWRDYVAFGMSTEQLSGISHLTGYAGDSPIFTGMNGGDPFVGVIAATALCAALYHRGRTGEGQHIDLSQVEACTLFVGDAVTGWTLSKVDPGRTGNSHPTRAPYGVYPCRTTNDERRTTNGAGVADGERRTASDERGAANDEGRAADGSGGWGEGGSMPEDWIAIDCRTDGQWATLARLIGCPEWAEAGSEFATVAGRLRQRETIDAAIAAWTRTRGHIELMDELQALGVPAGAVLSGPDLLADPHLAAWGGFIEQDRPGIGVKHYPSQPYRFRYAAPVPNRRAPLLGEHTDEVLRERLGLDEATLRDLERDDVTGTLPLAARPVLMERGNG